MNTKTIKELSTSDIYISVKRQRSPDHHHLDANSRLHTPATTYLTTVPNLIMIREHLKDLREKCYSTKLGTMVQNARWSATWVHICEDDNSSLGTYCNVAENLIRQINMYYII